MTRPDREAVEKAAAEFDRLGREAFMRRYGFSDRNITYEVLISAKSYPSKAIFGAAFGFMAGGEPRSSQTCNGTEAREHLHRLGFEIMTAGSRADHIREFVIANLIDPAKRRGEKSLEIVSGDVHARMGLENAMPSVCQVLEGKRFAQEAGVILAKRESPIDSDKPSSTIRYYFTLRAGVAMTLDRGALDQMKRLFLEHHPDFVTFSDCPSFAEDEGNYKRALVDEAQRLMLDMAHADDAEIGAALIELLAGRAGLFSNLIDWRAQKVIDNASEAQPGLVEAATGRLARAEDAGDAIAEWLDALWPTMRDNVVGNPFAESRMFPTMLRGLVDPQAVLPIRSTPTYNAMRALIGEPTFANAPLSREELQRVNAMAFEVRRIMDEEWDWEPRDLWDVQGFIWVTCQKKFSEEAGGALDLVPVWLVTSLWGEEDGLPRFLARSEWSLLTDTGSANNRRVREMEVGDRIFLKDFVPRAYDLPFDAGGGIVTANRYRAEGTITEASEDGLRVGVEWQEWDEPRTWYFYTSNHAVWHLRPPGESQYADRLRRFLLDREAQDHALFLNDPFWRDRLFGAGASEEMPTMQPTNLILYGPPGTGKTYRTAQEAVRLCDEMVPEDRGELMQRYDELSKEGRIRFVTFHQSFSYEEFVEGLRPETALSDDQESEGAGFRLEPRPGIFRELCAVASEALKGVGEPAGSFDFAGRHFWKMGLGVIGTQDSVYEACIADGYVALGWGLDIDWSDPRFDNIEAIREEFQSAPRENEQPSHYTQLHPFRNTMKVGDIIIVPHGNKAFRAVGLVVGDYYFEKDGEPTYYHRRRVRWLTVLDEPLPLDTIIEGNFMQSTFYSIPANRVNTEALARLVRSYESDGQAPVAGRPPQQFVLIIDEINRANISKVFGELITLIEPDKRLGMPNALKVRLPYSKREFGVPANLHIIGTMNTADRSIALLDTALRRRFRFEEMAPDTTVDAFRDAEEATGLPLADVLETMNRRIEYLVDRDHRIGHAFFIGCETKLQVDAVMRDKVIPLLQEYFFEDWNRLAAVLGEKDKGGNFLECDTIEDPMGEGGEPLKSWRVRDRFEDGAYTRLVSGKPAGPVAEIAA